MKIAIDISPLESSHRWRGIGVYTRNLVTALEKLSEADLEIKLVKKPGELKNADLVHYPYFDLFFPTLPSGQVIPTVLTIHDVIPLVFPKHYPPGIKGRLNFWRQKKVLGSAAAVICDSRNSQKDIQKYLHFPAEKTHVVYLAPQEIFKPVNSRKKLTLVSKKYSLPAKFILYVGGINYNKNVLGLAQASKIIRVPLVIVNKMAAHQDFNQEHPENQPLVQLIKQYGRDPDIRRVGFVPDSDLPAMYSLASVYCQPSFYEGFGLPVLEAMSCGCPVVSSNISSLPEVCGTAAVMVDPAPRKIAQGLQRVLTGKDLGNKLVSKGYAQAKKFTWEKTARETIKVYEKAFQTKKE